MTACADFTTALGLLSSRELGDMKLRLDKDELEATQIPCSLSDQQLANLIFVIRLRYPPLDATLAVIALTLPAPN